MKPIRILTRRSRSSSKKKKKHVWPRRRPSGKLSMAMKMTTREMRTKVNCNLPTLLRTQTSQQAPVTPVFQPTALFIPEDSGLDRTQALKYIEDSSSCERSDFRTIATCNAFRGCEGSAHCPPHPHCVAGMEARECKFVAESGIFAQLIMMSPFFADCPCGAHSPASAGKLHKQTSPDRWARGGGGGLDGGYQPGVPLLASKMVDQGRPDF